MDHDEENTDLAEIEANLYAKIHHDAPETIEQYSASALLQQQQQQAAPQPSRVVTNKSVVNNNPSNGPPKNNRYWGNAGSAAAVFTAPQQYRQKSSKRPEKMRGVNPFSMETPTEQTKKQVPTSDTISITTDYRPKPFTPYTSYLSQIGSQPVEVGLVVDNNKKIMKSTALPSLLDTVVQPPSVIQQKGKKGKKSSICLNPFNRLNNNKLNRTDKLHVKQERARLAIANVATKRTIDTIDLDTSSDGGDDDDVICIPVPPPPLVCIESSADEEDEEEQQPEQPVEVQATILPEDFVGHRDRSRVSQCLDDGEECLSGMDDDELVYISETIENAVRFDESERETERLALTNESEERSATDAVIFATPNKTKFGVGGGVTSSTPKHTYEVAENCFAAVDVYESESSDFPESVYGKGERRMAAATAAAAAACRETEMSSTVATVRSSSESDCSDIQINTMNRSKRMMKRKSSGSNKGSDYVVSDDDDDDGVAYVDIIKKTNTPYLQRGEAVANAKSSAKLPNVVRRKKAKGTVAAATAVSEHSDDEFMSMLSCIVHDDKEQNDESGAVNDDVSGPCQSTVDSSPKSIDARQVVEHVLGKKSKKERLAGGERGKKSADEQLATTETPKEGKSRKTWIVSDEIGETDPIDNVMLPPQVAEPLLLPVKKVSIEKKKESLDDQVKKTVAEKKRETMAEPVKKTSNEKKRETIEEPLLPVKRAKKDKCLPEGSVEPAIVVNDDVTDKDKLCVRSSSLVVNQTVIECAADADDDEKGQRKSEGGRSKHRSLPSKLII